MVHTKNGDYNLNIDLTEAQQKSTRFRVSDSIPTFVTDTYNHKSKRLLQVERQAVRIKNEDYLVL